MLKEIFFLLLTIFVAVNCNYCTDKCMFSLSFNDPFVVPENCQKVYGHGALQCHSDIQIDYIQRTIDFNLWGTENVPTGGSMYQMDIFSSFDEHNEQLTAKLQYSCAIWLDDYECAKNYTLERLQIMLDHESILYTMKDRLYDLKGSNVQQCYDLQNKTVNCMNGLCRAEVGGVQNPDVHWDPPIPYYKTYCNYYPPDDPFQNTTGLISTTTNGIPPDFGIFDRVHYVCNTNLCNGDENIKFIQQLVNDFNKLERVSRATTTISSGITITIVLLLIINYFFIY